MEESEIEDIILKFALYNAYQHGGKASDNAVLGKILGEVPVLRPKAKELMPVVNRIVKDVNSMDEQKIISKLEKLAPELLHKEKQQKHLVLPELPNINQGEQVVMRFAPGPSGPLHIGHTRAVILNDEYVKKYNGKFILRLEDTNPNNIDADAYDMIQSDLSWLEVKYHEMYRQCDRFELYYKYARELLTNGHAYICTCPVETWRSLKIKKQPCPDRDLPVEKQLSRWEKMLSRDYNPGDVSYIVKTDLTHPNPAVRDFVGFRMLSEPHPITKEKYYVYPTYNFSVAIDDHLMGITHILRGKDHLNNTYRQEFIYDYFNWPKPVFLHYGWVSMSEVMLKTTTIKEGIRSGKYSGWSDIQLGTLQALATRGIQPGAIRKYWLEVGIKEVDIEFSWENLYSYNKDIIDKTANRYFFVWEPVVLAITGINELESHAPLHPDDPSRGNRNIKFSSDTISEIVVGNDKLKGILVLVNKSDIHGLKPGTRLRLKDLCNIEFISLDTEKSTITKYIGNKLELIKEGVKIIHWVPENDNIPMTVYMPDGLNKPGFCESHTITAANQGFVVQFERFGFVKLGKLEPTSSSLKGWFTHR